MTSLARLGGALTGFLTGRRVDAPEDCASSSESLVLPSTFALFAGRPGISPEFEMSVRGSRDADEAVALRTKASMARKHWGCLVVRKRSHLSRAELLCAVSLAPPGSQTRSERADKGPRRDAIDVIRQRRVLGASSLPAGGSLPLGPLHSCPHKPWSCSGRRASLPRPSPARDKGRGTGSRAPKSNSELLPSLTQAPARASATRPTAQQRDGNTIISQPSITHPKSQHAARSTTTTIGPVAQCRNPPPSLTLPSSRMGRAPQKPRALRQQRTMEHQRRTMARMSQWQAWRNQE